MQQRVVTISAVAGLAAFGVLAGVQKACSQAPGRPVRAAVSSANPTGAMQNNTVASNAAYAMPAGEGRNDTPTTGESAQAGMAQDDPAEFGRPNPGRPAYADPEFQGEAGAGRGQGQSRNGGRNGQNGGQNGAPNGGQDQGQSQDDGEGQGQAEDADESILTVNDGFFFDNYTSGSGFGVYGGEAVTSGQERQLNLPSAGVNARNLGLPVLPNQPVGGGQPQQPEDPDNPDS